MDVGHFVILVHNSSFTFVLGERINKQHKGKGVWPEVISATQTHTWKTFQLQRKCMASSFRNGNFSSDIGTISPHLLQYFGTDKYCLVGLRHYNYSYSFKIRYTIPKKDITNITFGTPSALEGQSSSTTLKSQRTLQ
jgi:hypothetical protein